MSSVPARTLMIVLCLATSASGQEREGRPLTVNDLFRLEQLREAETAFSSGGRRAAYVRVRAASSTGT
jgi:hypothetical protein